MTTDWRSGPGSPGPGDAERRRVLTLVADDGDRHVLTTWLGATEAYEAVSADTDLATVSFDCCIVDLAGLLAEGDTLVERTADAEVPLPVLLIVPDARVDEVHQEFPRDHPELWSLVDGVLRTPLTTLELESRLESLWGLRQQAERLHRQQQTLASRGEQLALLNRVLRHDVRNDMNVVTGWVDELYDHVDEPGVPLLDNVSAAANHVVDLTRDARELVETIDADEDAALDPIDLGAVIEAEVARRRETFEDATIELSDVPRGVTVAANELLSSVFRNLINNAVQHNDTDAPTVTVGVTQRDGRVTVRVADDGPGIPDDHKELLFGADTKGMESDGSGMGLYLVERLVDIYGGDVRVEDNEPRGAVLVVDLPTLEDEPTDGRAT